jgi:Ankyrin repeats (3 copies)
LFPFVFEKIMYDSKIIHHKRDQTNGKHHQQQQQQFQPPEKMSSNEPFGVNDHHPNGTPFSRQQHHSNYLIVPPQIYLDKLLSSRGYTIQKWNTLETSYYHDPCPYQEACYTTYMVNIVKNNDYHQLRQLLQCRLLAFNPCNYYGESLFHLACRLGKYDSILVMMEVWGKHILQISDDYGRNPLHDACWAAHVSFPIIKLLLDHDIQLLYMKDSRGATPLSYVSRDHWAEWVCFLDDQKEIYWPTLPEATTTTPIVMNVPSDNNKDECCSSQPSLLQLDKVELNHSLHISSMQTYSYKQQHNVSSRIIELAHQVAMGMIQPDDAIVLSQHSKEQPNEQWNHNNDNDSLHSIISSSSDGEIDDNNKKLDHHHCSDNDCCSDDESVLSSSIHSYMNEQDMEEMLLRIQASKTSDHPNKQQMTYQ